MPSCSVKQEGEEERKKILRRGREKEKELEQREIHIEESTERESGKEETRWSLPAAIVSLNVHHVK